MRALLLVFLAGCCAHGSGEGTTTTSTTTTPAGCLCDCPDGPPEPPTVDAFCADSANDGAACCFGQDVGLCKDHECVQ